MQDALNNETRYIAQERVFLKILKDKKIIKRDDFEYSSDTLFFLIQEMM